LFRSHPSCSRTRAADSSPAGRLSRPATSLPSGPANRAFPGGGRAWAWTGRRWARRGRGRRGWTWTRARRRRRWRGAWRGGSRRRAPRLTHPSRGNARRGSEVRKADPSEPRMIMFSRSDLDELVAVDNAPAVSLYLPTHVAGREIRQDPIRLKNLLSSAAERLAATWRRPEIEELLEPAGSLAGDEDFWRHQQQGLAVFLAPGFNRIHKLPVPVPEETFLADHFHIKPLLPLLEDAGLFWLLTISAKRTGLYRGSRWEFAEAREIDLPQGVGKIRGMTAYEETQYASPVGRRGTLAHAQSFCEAPEELRKSELIEFLHRVAAAVQPRLKGNRAPVILAAHPEIQGHFREIAGWK